MTTYFSEVMRLRSLKKIVGEFERIDKAREEALRVGANALGLAATEEKREALIATGGISLRGCFENILTRQTLHEVTPEIEAQFVRLDVQEQVLQHIYTSELSGK